ncbi:hypothetical protein B0H14DRAFT_2647884 [Mycena olivaceomarginata]|nr:hypothetical protein B0H14DRAFT_2647884 [Mycena olivaceomarginata]
MADFPFAQRLGYFGGKMQMRAKINCDLSELLAKFVPCSHDAIWLTHFGDRVLISPRKNVGGGKKGLWGFGQCCQDLADTNIEVRDLLRARDEVAPTPKGPRVDLLVLHQGIPRHFPDSDTSESPVQLLSVSPVRCFNIYHSGCQYGGHYFARSVDNWLTHLTSLPTPVIPSLFANPFSGPEFCHHNHFPTSTHPSPLFLRWLYFILPLTMCTAQITTTDSSSSTLARSPSPDLDMGPPARMTVYPREKEPQDEVPMLFVTDYHETLLCIGFNTRIEGERYLDYIQTWTWQIGVPVSFANRLIFSRSEGIYLISSTVTDTIPGYTLEHLNFELPMDYFPFLSQLASYLAVHGRTDGHTKSTFEQSSDSSAPIDGSCPSALRDIQRKDGEWIALVTFAWQAHNFSLT